MVAVPIFQEAKVIHIYTGNGKGKTSAAFGLAMRASGQGLKVIIFQFLKPRPFLSGEELSVKKLRGIKLVKFNQMHPMFGMKGEKLIKTIEEDFKIARKAILSSSYDMIVLDEIINAVDQGFIEQGNFIKLLKAVPKKVELVLTGRGDISNMEQYAHYVTVMVDKKHPFKQSKTARRGIEY